MFVIFTKLKIFITKKTKYLLVAFSFIYLNLQIFAQQTPVYGCATEFILNQSVYGDLPRFSSPLPNSSNCSKTSTSFNDYFKRPDNYMFQNFYRPGVPPSAYYPNRVEPKKTVVINLVFFGEDNSSGYPLQPNPSPDVSVGSNIYLWLNEHNDYTQPSNVAVCHPLSITKTGIEIKVNKVYFYPSSAHLHATQNGSNGNSIVNSENAMTHHLSHNPDAANQINCIIVQYCGIPGAMGFASVMNYQGVSIPFTYSGSNYFNNNYGQEWVAGYSLIAQHLPHEIGHHLDMRHPYDWGETGVTNYNRLIDLFPCTGIIDPLNLSSIINNMTVNNLT